MKNAGSGDRLDDEAIVLLHWSFQVDGDVFFSSHGAKEIGISVPEKKRQEKLNDEGENREG